MAAAVVEITESQSICVRRGRELIRLDRQLVDLDLDVVENARQQLLGRRGDQRGLRFRAGYMLGVKETMEASMPAAFELKRQLNEQVVEPVGHCRSVDFGFSFFKAGEGEPPKASEGVHYDGYHLDTHQGVGPRVELLRVLVNLSARPRVFSFAAIDRYEMEERGCGLGRDEYSVTDLPPDVEDRVLEIPAFDGQTVTYLTFWASVVPHVGTNTDAGYFLASFEALADYRAEGRRNRALHLRS